MKITASSLIRWAGLSAMAAGVFLPVIATFRAGVLPRWAGGLLAVAGPLGPVAVGLLPHALERYVGMPLGLALVWLGYELWSERRARASEPAPDGVSPQLA